MFKRALILLFVAFVTIESNGQVTGSTADVLYRSDASGMIYANTRGYGILFRRGKHVTAKVRSYWEIDLQTLRHPKEASSSGDAPVRRKYVYGKVNSVLLLRASIGFQNVLFGKADHKAVEVRYSYSIGPVLAFAKPYYVAVYKNSGAGISQYTLMKFNTENFSSDSGRIAGRGSFTDGLGELAVYPGVNAKFGLSFEYAPYTNLIRAIETNIMLDYFPKALPIMARNPSENFIVTLSVGFVFGRKWY